MLSHQIFDQHKYIYCPKLLDEESCSTIVSEFKNQIELGNTVKDNQSPLSHSLGHSILFDSLLEQMQPAVEEITNKKLHPTYSYARWYQPGDELKIHRDRPSCEISVTITLGFEGNPWAIYMGYDKDKQNCSKIAMQIGDAVIYRGLEMFHWREKYVEGKWQAQVFLHYVDADGPHADLKYDKREKLAHHQNQEQSHAFRVFPSVYSAEKCQNIIDSFEKQDEAFIPALLSGNVLNKEIRDAQKIQIPTQHPLVSSLIGFGFQANHYAWNFNISHSNQSEYLRYGKEGKFNTHIDSFISNINQEIRKLTIILILNNNFEGGKLYFGQENDRTYPKQDPGDLIVFPSFMTHGVEPILKGTRSSIVTWLMGPYFK
jgi:hypothetical protein